MQIVEEFIDQYEGEQQKIMLYFHHLFVDQLGLIDKIKYKIPFYYGKSWVCYLNPTKDSKIELAFTRGNELSNAQGLLSNKGRKQIFGIEFSKLSEIPKEAIDEIIQEALLLDETKPYQSKRNKI